MGGASTRPSCSHPVRRRGGVRPPRTAESFPRAGPEDTDASFGFIPLLHPLPRVPARSPLFPSSPSPPVRYGEVPFVVPRARSLTLLVPGVGGNWHSFGRMSTWVPGSGGLVYPCPSLHTLQAQFKLDRSLSSLRRERPRASLSTGHRSPKNQLLRLSPAYHSKPS